MGLGRTILGAFLGFVIGFSGSVKLTGALVPEVHAEMVKNFNGFADVGCWDMEGPRGDQMRTIIGGAEIAAMIGLIGILGTSLQRLAAFLLAVCIMAPAIYTHVQANDGQFAPPAVIMVLSLLLASGWSTGGKKSADPKAAQKAKKSS